MSSTFPPCRTGFTEFPAPAKGAFESAPVKTPATAVNPIFSKGDESSRMADRGFESRRSGQISQATLQLGEAAASTHRTQSPSPFSGTKSPPEDLGWDAVGTWESPAEKVPTTSTRAMVSQAVVSKEERALEMARRKEERKQVCHNPEPNFDQLNMNPTFSSASLCSRNKRKSLLVKHECCYKPCTIQYPTCIIVLDGFPVTLVSNQIKIPKRPTTSTKFDAGCYLPLECCFRG